MASKDLCIIAYVYDFDMKESLYQCSNRMISPKYLGCCGQFRFLDCYRLFIIFCCHHISLLLLSCTMLCGLTYRTIQYTHPSFNPDGMLYCLYPHMDVDMIITLEHTKHSILAQVCNSAGCLLRTLNKWSGLSTDSIACGYSFKFSVLTRFSIGQNVDSAGLRIVGVLLMDRCKKANQHIKLHPYPLNPQHTKLEKRGH